jgi:hypothetical protein
VFKDYEALTRVLEGDIGAAMTVTGRNPVFVASAISSPDFISFCKFQASDRQA